MSSVLGSLRKAREWAMPTLKESAFLEKGVLTPEEFVKAGDELVYRCPTWAWEAGDPSKLKNYLPADKQYLITRNVPCQNRVSSMETAMEMHSAKEDGEGDEDDDWLVSSIIKATEKLDLEDEFDILDDNNINNSSHNSYFKWMFTWLFHSLSHSSCVPSQDHSFEC